MLKAVGSNLDASFLCVLKKNLKAKFVVSVVVCLCDRENKYRSLREYHRVCLVN